MKSIFNVNGDSRVINPRNGSDQFVDLLTDQQIGGIKRFINNLITNSDVNFNTTANVGRIIFYPNEPGGSGSQIVSIYTTDKNDGQGWFFDSVGNLYYLGAGLAPIKIMLSGGTGDLTIVGNLTSDVFNSYSGGDITFNNGIALGYNTINSGNITSNGTINAVDIHSTGIIYANDVNLTSTGYLNVNNITSSVASGSYQTKIALSNEFIDINNSSLDIVATYVGFASPIQTLSTASKYMFIKPLSTGNFEMLMNNIANKILSSDWATTKISSQYIWNLNNISNQNAIILDSLTTSGNRLQIYGTPSGTKYLYYNISDELGVINSSTSQWKITGTGDATFSSLNAGSGSISTTGTISGGTISGTISTSGAISCGAISCSSLNANSGTISTTGNMSCQNMTSLGSIYGLFIDLQETGSILTNRIYSKTTTGSYTTNINLSNEFIDTGNSSLDIIAQYIGFANPQQTLTTASKYMYVKPLSTGNFEMIISNVTNKILSSDWATTKMASQFIWNFNNASNITNITLDAIIASGNRLQIYGIAGGTKYLFFNTTNAFGLFDTSLGYTIWNIYGSTGNFSTIGIITANTINANTGTTISTDSIWNFKNGANIPILLDPTIASGDRLKIYGVAGGTKYLYFNTSNNIGVYNTSTGASVWSIDGTTGNINTIGTLTYATLSATSFLCNSISPVSGTVIAIGITSQFYWLKSAGVGRISMFPSSTSGDIMQITRVGDTSYTSGYWYFNNSGNFGYNTGGVSVWELLNSGGLNLRGDLSMISSSIIYNDTFNAINLTDGSTYRNYIKMNTLFTASTIGSIELSSRYISFVNPYQTLSSLSKYMFILPDSGGNFSQYINNVNNRLLQSNWSLLTLTSDYSFECYDKYNYIEHNKVGNISGFWSKRTGVGGTIYQNGNSWVCCLGMECNTNGNIGGGGFNAGNAQRAFMWLIEDTTGSGKALGLACNRISGYTASINTSSQNVGFALLGYYATNRGGAAYSFTGEHSSMVCDEEYNDLMNYNTDVFIGMVVCSSGKIYNLPYDVDGNTYTKQVDNIKSVDAQPMTRLSKKYKDKSVLGAISHIEKVGKNRNDLNATSWTGCMTLDKDERRRIRVACIGEGGIWITNEYGNIENGDYITTSNIAGYATKQDDDLMHNYTIAKATMDCNFDIEKPDEYKTKYLGDGVYASYIACTFHCG